VVAAAFSATVRAAVRVFAAATPALVPPAARLAADFRVGLTPEAVGSSIIGSSARAVVTLEIVLVAAETRRGVTGRRPAAGWTPPGRTAPP
jgi:hypothetical protein